MQKWFIKYWEDSGRRKVVERWLDKLSREGFEAVAKELKLLEVCGNKLKLPHSKSLGKGLLELRERRYGYRIYYTFFKDQVIVLLAAGDKSSQDSDIKVARQRLAYLIKD